MDKFLATYFHRLSLIVNSLTKWQLKFKQYSIGKVRRSRVCSFSRRRISNHSELVPASFIPCCWGSMLYMIFSITILSLINRKTTSYRMSAFASQLLQGGCAYRWRRGRHISGLLPRLQQGAAGCIHHVPLQPQPSHASMRKRSATQETAELRSSVPRRFDFKACFFFFLFKYGRFHHTNFPP